MRLEFLLLVAAAFPLCLSQRSHDSREDSLQNSLQDSRQGSHHDSRVDSRQDSRRSRRRSVATPRLLPAPLVLQIPSEQGPPQIRCLAPRRFSGSTFELLPGTPGIPEIPLQSVPAAPDRHWADFSLPGAARCFQCRYRSHNGSAWMESELSPRIGSTDLGDAGCQPSNATVGPPPTAGSLREDPSWLLPVSIGASVLVLLLLLGAAFVAWRGLQRWRGRSHTAPSFPMAPAPTSPSK